MHRPPRKRKFKEREGREAMAKGGDLWDDSALTNAFDQAMFKYKKMHIKGYEESLVGSREAKAKEVIVEAPSNEECKRRRKMERAGFSLNTLESTLVKPKSIPQPLTVPPHVVCERRFLFTLTTLGLVETMCLLLPASSSIGADNNTSSQMLKAAEGKVDNLPFAKDNKALDSQVHQEYAEVPNDIPLQDQNQIHSSSQDLEEYDLLCTQYNELEEKRGQIWEKLQQYGHTDYSYPVGTSGSCTQWPSTSAFQSQYYSSQACYPAMAIACCPNVYPCPTTSCSLPTCSLGYSGPCTGSSLTTNNERMAKDDDIIKKGMEAAQKALSKLKEDASDCQLDEQSLKQKEPITNGETDLTEVLNAWYSAGLYTGKYLTEKSLAKSRNG
ncbi:hypothetical protein V2J09_020329 [Rumex salicifolius]